MRRLEALKDGQERDARKELLQGRPKLPLPRDTNAVVLQQGAIRAARVRGEQLT